MKTRLPLLILLITLGFGGISLNAQSHGDLKLNVGGLIILNPGIGYEHIPNPNTGIGLSVNYRNWDLGSDEFNWTLIAPIFDYRYYFTPKRGGDGFFVGPYGKFAFGSIKDEDTNESINTSRFALGVAPGWKVVSEGGFVFEIFLGLGRGWVLGSSEEGDFEEAYDLITKLDFRFGLVAGYRLK